MEEILELCVKSLECSHPSFMDNKCLWCNTSITDCGDPATLPFRYIHPSLAFNLDEVTQVQKDNMQYLLNRKKLHLVLDLDHTLIHARKIKKFKSKHRQNIRAMMYDDISELKLSNGDEYVVKLRPGVHVFLKQVSTMFDLSICTMGNREYAHKVVEKLGGLAKFSWVISREDCVKAKQKALDVVLSCRQATLIVDDTESVWEESCKANLIKINRYDYDFFPIEEAKEDLDRELARVLDILREVHIGFYDVGNKKVEYGMKDAREELEKVLISRGLGFSNQEQCEKDQKIGDDEQPIAKTKELCKMKRLKIKMNGVFLEEPTHVPTKVLDPLVQEQCDQDQKPLVESQEGSVATSKPKRLRIRLNGVLLQHDCTPVTKRRKTQDVINTPIIVNI